MRRLVGTIALPLMLAAAACSSSGTAPTTTKPHKTSSTTAPHHGSPTTTMAPPTTTTTASCAPIGSTITQQNAVTPPDRLLTDVTTASSTCLDTITFSFRLTPDAPSYKVEYATGPFYDSAGRQVTPAGTAYLRVRFQPAQIADLSQEKAPLTFTGPRRIIPTDTKAVRSLYLYDASEAVIGWVVGLDMTRPFTVDAVPGRVTITVSTA